MSAYTRPLLLASLLLAPVASALEIRIDYTYDTKNFFNTAEKRNAIEAVARFYGDMITDKLLRIDASEFGGASWTAYFPHPETGANQFLPNLVVPEDTIIVFVGARDLPGTTVGQGGNGGYSQAGAYSSDWFDRLDGRGSVAAAVKPVTLRTDFALWGGAITFDTPRTWNFSLTGNQAGTEFVGVALHEMGHVLGIGTSDSWVNKLSGGTFTGSAAIRSHGSAPAADSSHFQGSLTSPLFGSFGVTHGNVRPVLMLPGSIDTNSNFDVATDLDLAALVDIGWQLQPPTRLKATALSPTAAAFQWQSVSFKNYALQRSGNLATFPAGSGTIAGNGTMKTWTDPSPPPAKAFYRLAATDVFPAAAAPPAAPMRFAAGGTYLTRSVPPREITDCGAAH